MSGTAARTSTHPDVTPTEPSRRRRGTRRVSALGVASAPVIVTYLSVIVALPLAALVSHGLGIGIETNGAGLAIWHWQVHTDFSSFWHSVSAPGAWRAIWLSLWISLVVAFVNTVMGVVIAWVLVRDDFPGRRFVDSVIDLPFALPTIVAGVVILLLYGDASPVHVNLFETWMGLTVALLFVTLPFSVRAVQPVLENLDREPELAARSLGAGSFRVMFDVVVPAIMPAALSGFSLAFARSIGEFGSISLIAGGIGKTTTGSMYVYNLTEGFLWSDAAAVSSVLLAISVLVLSLTGRVSRSLEKRIAT